MNQNTTTPGQAVANSTVSPNGNLGRYDAFFRQLESALTRDTWLGTLYHRTLTLEAAFTWSALIVVPACLLAGFCGSLATLALMLRARRSWAKPHVYMACLMPANAAVLAHQFLSQTLHRGLFSYTKGRYEFPLYPSDWFCAGWSFIMTTASGYAMLLMVALMLDRLHALTLPFNYRRRGLQFSRRVALVLAILAVALACPVLPLYVLSRSLVFLDSGALLPNCFVAQSQPQVRDIMTAYLFAVHRGGLVSVLTLGCNAFLAHRVRSIQRGSKQHQTNMPTGTTRSDRDQERSSTRVTVVILSLSLFYTATLTPAAAVLGIGTIYAISAPTRDTDTVAYYLNVTYWTNMGLLSNVLYAVFYGFSWVIYARDVTFVRQPVAAFCRRLFCARARAAGTVESYMIQQMPVSSSVGH